MDDIQLSPGYAAFSEALDRLRRTQGEVTYWHARDIQPVLGYTNWENFAEAIERAKVACGAAGVDPDNQFHPIKDMVEVGSGAKRERADWYLSRYACYLIAMSGDGSKREVAHAKTYFAIQTHRAEAADKLTTAEKRLIARERVRNANKSLNAAAQKSGVQKYAVFHDAGYKGLYDGLGQAEIKAKKGIPEKESLLDCMDRTELAANEFRITQTEQKLLRDKVNTEVMAIHTHGQVGAQVRDAIKKLGGTMPEDLPPAEPIKKVLSARKKALKAVPGKK